MATQLNSRWPILLEPLDAAAAALTDLGRETPRLAFLGQNLTWIRTNLQAAARSAP